jgi:hypothetical protein
LAPAASVDVPFTWRSVLEMNVDFTAAPPHITWDVARKPLPLMSIV